MQKRPAGITILVVIYFLIAVVMLMPNLKGDINLTTLAIAGILLIAAVGLFIGQKWAWWIISIMTALAVVLSLITVTQGLINLENFSAPPTALLKSGGRLLVQSLILTFMLSKPVIDFVKLSHIKTIVLLGSLLGAAVSVILTMALYGRLFG